MDLAPESKSRQVDEAVDNLNQIVAHAMEKFRKDGVTPDSGPRKVATRRMLQLFQEADLAARARMNSRLSKFSKDDLAGHARVMAIQAVRNNSPELVREGLIALAAESGTGSDRRDSQVSLAQLYHSAVKLGMDAPTAFEQAGALAVNDFGDLIRSFPQRPPEKRSLAAFGLKETMTKDGFDYRLL